AGRQQRRDRRRDDRRRSDREALLPRGRPRASPAGECALRPDHPPGREGTGKGRDVDPAVLKPLLFLPLSSLPGSAMARPPLARARPVAMTTPAAPVPVTDKPLLLERI